MLSVVVVVVAAAAVVIMVAVVMAVVGLRLLFLTYLNFRTNNPRW